MTVISGVVSTKEKKSKIQVNRKIFGWFLVFSSVIKVGLSLSKKACVISLIENPLEMMKNAFYFILQALFVLKLFKLLSRLFGHVGKTA